MTDTAFAFEYAMACILDALYTPHECHVMDTYYVPSAWYACGDELI